MVKFLQRPGRGVRGMAWLILGLVGCGGAAEDLPREPVAGTVTFDGQPLKKGTIQFQPIGQSPGVASGGTVEDGKFEVARSEGPVPGKYNVSVFADASSSSSSAEGVAPPVPTPGARKSLEELRGVIPAKYNVQTELVAEVKPGGPNQFTFDLKK